MQINLRETRQYLKESDFENLFTQQLGWDNHTQTLNIPIDETEYTLTAIAEKRGMVVFECPATGADGRIPDYATRRKIQKQVAKSVHEHFIIYTDAEKTTDIYQWVKREQGKPDACREHRYNRDEHSGESLIQKLQAIAFTFEEEEQLTLFEVTGRVGAAFYAERVTKKFYDRFKKEHGAFLKFLKGIPDEEMQKWYVSVMLNRLMFIYFIQKKGFLDDDIDYLRTKLTESQTDGTNRYYKDFLCPLFFEGFAKPEDERSREMKRLLGKIPYLNGGIFQQHQLETLHGENIEIPDKAFEQIFNFFEQYDWHLDDRPLKNDNEINPDVLGYIFEKYINQKQMGAYYTKEDITEYISKNTIIPFLFDKARKACKIAFEGDASVWNLLQEDPDRYIYDAVKKGFYDADKKGVKKDLPPEIAIGINDVSKRTDWNTLAPEEYALPTEIWRETVARRQRYETIRAKLANGEITDINDLITYNLDIRQFAQDVIENCEGPELLRAFWKAITEVTILDPTCGSGAFLFAALNILEPLYEACLDRMQVFLDESTRKFKKFPQILEDVKKHPNRRYFVLKSIIINNLYGVDIMEEAVEICKLRLFLKMVAQIEDVRQIEPLPDIDFNIQAGNTLVGYATYDAVEKPEKGRFDFENAMKRIRENAEDVKILFQEFRRQQTTLGGAVTSADKQVLQDRLQELEDELNLYLAEEYGVDPNKQSDYESWLNTHKPFHWFIAFYGILEDGGFDVIIGNPPYVEYSKVRKDYTIKGYETESCGNLYAFITERTMSLLKICGQLGKIIPVASVCTDRYFSLQNLLRNSGRSIISSYNDRPGKLFDGLDHIRLSIILCKKDDSISSTLFTTKYNKWHTVARPNLFHHLEYLKATNHLEQSIAKLHSNLETEILEKVFAQKKNLDFYTRKSGQHTIYYTPKLSGFVQILDFIPTIYDENGDIREPSLLKAIKFGTNRDRDVFLALLNSNLFYWLVTIFSDCRNLNKREIYSMRFDIENASVEIINHLSILVQELMEDFQRHSKIIKMNYKNLGTTLSIQCIYPKMSKIIIDKIDCVLAQHYGFTDKELEFIINYDIKYRMGLGNWMHHTTLKYGENMDNLICKKIVLSLLDSDPKSANEITAEIGEIVLPSVF